MANVYWVGQDGNIWLKTAQGTQNMGKPNGVGAKDVGFDAERGSAEAQRIADPLANANPAGTGGTGGGTPAKVMNTAAANATQQAIDSLAIEQSTGNKNIDDSTNAVLDKYGREAQKAEADYGDQTVTNDTNLQKNKQNAMVSAAQGRRGLRGTLASIGALSGDGVKLADRAVTEGANQDIGEATDTAATNATTLKKAKDNFDEEDKQRRAEAETARVNQKTALEGSVLSKRQQYLQKLAEIFSEGGNTGRAGELLNEAGSLNGQIASKTAVQAAPLVAKGAAFTPGTLESYLAGAGDMTVEVAPGGEGGDANPTILAGKTRKEDRDRLLATV